MPGSGASNSGSPGVSASPASMDQRSRIPAGLGTKGVTPVGVSESEPTSGAAFTAPGEDTVPTRPGIGVRSAPGAGLADVVSATNTRPGEERLSGVLADETPFSRNR